MPSEKNRRILRLFSLHDVLIAVHYCCIAVWSLSSLSLVSMVELAEKPYFCQLIGRSIFVSFQAKVDKLVCYTLKEAKKNQDKETKEREKTRVLLSIFYLLILN